MEQLVLILRIANCAYNLFINECHWCSIRHRTADVTYDCLLQFSDTCCSAAFARKIKEGKLTQRVVTGQFADGQGSSRERFNRIVEECSGLQKRARRR